MVLAEYAKQWYAHQMKTKYGSVPIVISPGSIDGKAVREMVKKKLHDLYDVEEYERFFRVMRRLVDAREE